MEQNNQVVNNQTTTSQPEQSIVQEPQGQEQPGVTKENQNLGTLPIANNQIVSNLKMTTDSGRKNTVLLFGVMFFVLSVLITLYFYFLKAS